MEFDIKKIVRPHLESVKPYSTAKDDYTGKASILLDEIGRAHV